MASCLTALRCILPLPVLAQGAGIALVLLCCCSRLLPSTQLPVISANGSGNVSLGHPHFLGKIVSISWLQVEDYWHLKYGGDPAVPSDYGGGHELPSSTYQRISSMLLQATTGTVLFSMLHFAHFIQYVPFILITKLFPRPGPKDLDPSLGVVNNMEGKITKPAVYQGQGWAPHPLCGYSFLFSRYPEKSKLVLRNENTKGEAPEWAKLLS